MDKESDIDNQTGDSIRESDENKGSNYLGNGILEVDDCLGGDLDAKHDENTDDNKKEGRQKVGNVAEDPPNRQKSLETGEAGAVLSISGLAQKTIPGGGKILHAGNRLTVELGDSTVD